MSTRLALAAWSWAKHRYLMRPQDRPPFVDVKFSLLLPFHRIVFKGDRAFWCLQTTEWGGLGIALRQVIDPIGQLKLWEPTSDVHWLHVAKVSEWTGSMCDACCPLELQIHSPRLPNNVLVKESSPRMSLLRLAFSLPIELPMRTCNGWPGGWRLRLLAMQGAMQSSRQLQHTYVRVTARMINELSLQKWKLYWS